MDQITGKDSKEMPWPKDIRAITLFVEDVAVTKEFYTRVFGFAVVFEDDDSAVYSSGAPWSTC